MSYHNRRHAIRRYGQPLGMTEDEMYEIIGRPFANPNAPGGVVPDTDAICRNAMRDAGKHMEGDRYTVVDNLQKRTFYRTLDFEKIVVGVQDMLTKAKNDLYTLRNEDWGSAGAMPAINEELFQLFKRLNESITYTQNYQYAKAQGIEVIDAPGLWRWVEKSLMDLELAVGVIAYVACKKPIWLSAVQWLYEKSLFLIGIAKTAVNAAITVGKAILKIPDVAGTVWTYLKWGAIIGGGLFLATKVRQQVKTGGW